MFEFLLNFSEFLVLAPCCYLLSLLLALLPSSLYVYVHAVRFLLELSMPLPSLSCWFSITFKPATCASFASGIPSPRSFLPRVCRYIEHAQQNSIAQPRVPFTVHAHYVPPGQTDTWTNIHTDTWSDELPLNDLCGARSHSPPIMFVWTLSTYNHIN